MRKKVSVTCFAVLSALCIIFLLPVCVMAAETGDKKEGAYTYRYNEEYAGICRTRKSKSGSLGFRRGLCIRG